MRSKGVNSCNRRAFVFKAIYRCVLRSLCKTLAVRWSHSAIFHNARIGLGRCAGAANACPLGAESSLLRSAPLGYRGAARPRPGSARGGSRFEDVDLANCSTWFDRDTFLTSIAILV